MRLSAVLRDAGHKVVWWTSTYSHASKTTRRMSDYSEVEGLGFRFIPTRPYAKNISLSRIVNHRQFSAGVIRAMRMELEGGGQPDKIIVSLPLIGAAAGVVRLAGEFSIPVVIDVQDVWPDSFRVLLPKGQLFDVISRFLFWPIRRKVRAALKQADQVVATCETYRGWVEELGGDAEKYFYLGADRRGRIAKSENRRLANFSDRDTSAIRLIYTGSMGAAYDLETIIRVIQKFKEEGCRLRVDFAGSGQQESKLKKKVERIGLTDSIFFHGFLDSQALDDLLSTADVGIIAMHSASQVVMPNKAADYLSAGLAVANTLPGELERKLSEYGCGRTYSAGDPESLVEALRPWLESADALAGAKAGASRLFDEHFDAAKIYPKYAEWVSGA